MAVDDTPLNRDVIEDMVTWLLDGARTVNTPNHIVDEMGQRFIRAGMPLVRLAVFVRTLHPSVFGRAFVWRPGEETTVVPVGYEIGESSAYRDNPVVQVVTNRTPLRRSITAESRAEFSILEELAHEGATDYFALPLHFTDNSVHVVSFASARKEGFSDDDLWAMERIQLPLARVAEIYAFRRTTQVLLNTYLGHQSGTRVLNGMIRRGDGDHINAVIWFTDLRHSTDLADQLSQVEFLALLNDYFEAMAGSVLEHDGEVLRFIGDAALAIFPVGEEPDDATTACRAAAAAAHDALERIRVLNTERQVHSQPLIEVGIGLHLGDVTYGNVGAENRLEFTVIGAAANEAARIEGLCKTLKRPVLASAEVVTHLDDGWESMGAHPLRGVGREIEIYARAV